MPHNLFNKSHLSFPIKITLEFNFNLLKNELITHPQLLSSLKKLADPLTTRKERIKNYKNLPDNLKGYYEIIFAMYENHKNYFKTIDFLPSDGVYLRYMLSQHLFTCLFDLLKQPRLNQNNKRWAKTTIKHFDSAFENLPKRQIEKPLTNYDKLFFTLFYLLQLLTVNILCIFPLTFLQMTYTLYKAIFNPFTREEFKNWYCAYKLGIFSFPVNDCKDLIDPFFFSYSIETVAILFIVLPIGALTFANSNKLENLKFNYFSPVKNGKQWMQMFKDEKFLEIPALPLDEKYKSLTSFQAPLRQPEHNEGSPSIDKLHH